MATPCPQGWTDVEFPTTTVEMFRQFDFVAWDAEEGVYKLTDAGVRFVERIGAELPPV